MVMYISKKLFQILAALLITACAIDRPEVAMLFAQPESLSGQSASECGLLQFGFENHNFYPSRREAREDSLGVGVAPGSVTYEELRSHHDQRVCLAGLVRYSGCATTSICSASNFPYEIIVDKMSEE